MTLVVLSSEESFDSGSSEYPLFGKSDAGMLGVGAGDAVARFVCVIRLAGVGVGTLRLEEGVKKDGWAILAPSDTSFN